VSIASIVKAVAAGALAVSALLFSGGHGPAVRAAGAPVVSAAPGVVAPADVTWGG
jgi:hypothetical protein